MTVHLCKETIPYAEMWEKLCLETGNFLQSHYYDTINAVYNSVPYYVYVTDDKNELLGGCRILVNGSRRLPNFIKSISRTATHFGEYLIAPHYDEEITNQTIQLIHNGISQLLKKERITYMQVYGHYGYKTHLYTSPLLTHIKRIDIGIIKLEQSTDTLWDNLHSKHRNVIRKAEKDGVVIICDNDYPALKKLLYETYKAQADITMPSPQFLDSFYNVTKQAGQCRIYNSYYNGAHCGSTFIHIYGSTAEYTFAGSNKIHNGANTLMQWQIIQDMKALGCKTYNLGEIADKTETYNNPHFEEGISSFKKRFGGLLLPSFSADLVLSPVKYKIWKSIVLLLKKK